MARTAIVTGSTSGIGEGVARALAAAGNNIVLNGFGDAAAIEHTGEPVAMSTPVVAPTHESRQMLPTAPSISPRRSSFSGGSSRTARLPETRLSAGYTSAFPRCCRTASWTKKNSAS